MNFTDFSHYLFVFAHPDDEVYTCAFVEQLTRAGKCVDVLYITSGDYQGLELGPVREKEVLASMRLLGVPATSVHFLRIPERQLMLRVGDAKAGVAALAQTLAVDCIVGHDYEGGHNGHDAVSFCTSHAATILHATLYVFPAYHGWPENRVWNAFAGEQKATETLSLTFTQQELQEKVIALHESQASFFDLLKRSADFESFSHREILRRIEHPIDYTQPPTTPIGYEFPGSKIRFEDFKEAVQQA